MKVILGISGASGAIYGIRLLEQLNAAGVETHLIISKWGIETIKYETEYKLEDVMNMADYHYDINNMMAAVSSGSFRHHGMIIAPCSMKTLSSISNSSNDNLIARAADVTLKERRKLVLMVRETPLNTIHLQNMLNLSSIGAVILPPTPAFYHHPKTIDEIINHTVSRMMDQLDINNDLVTRWG